MRFLVILLDMIVAGVAEVFDLLGKVTPVIRGMKLDLRELLLRNLHWDDKIPDNRKQIWLANFRTIINLRYNYIETSCYTQRRSEPHKTIQVMPTI